MIPMEIKKGYVSNKKVITSTKLTFIRELLLRLMLITGFDCQCTKLVKSRYI